MVSRPTLAQDEPAGVIGTVGETEEIFRQRGRDFLTATYTALKSLRLYPLHNSQVQRALDEVTEAARVLLQHDHTLEIQLSGAFIFLNSTRLRHDLHHFASFSYVHKVLLDCCVGTVRVDRSVDRTSWQVFLSLLLSLGSEGASLDTVAELQFKLSSAGIYSIQVEPPSGTDDMQQDAEQGKAAAKRIYERALTMTRKVLAGARLQQGIDVKKTKRAVQGIVDQVLKNEVSILGLTTIRDYDEYTFVHSVNVCILSVSLGKRIGLTKPQLYDLGLSALLHDIGKSRVPPEVLRKPGELTDAEWETMRNHPGLGVLSLFDLRGLGEIPYRSIIVAHEHHQRLDRSGYPQAIRSGELSLYSRIVAVADCYDATTSRRVYRTEPFDPARVLQEMWENREHGYDPVVVKALINLLGIYPVGTCVVLDSHEIAVVHSANPDPSQLNRPIVCVVSTSEGVALNPGVLVDLADTDGNSRYKRSIIKVTDPTNYGINCTEYFV